MINKRNPLDLLSSKKKLLVMKNQNISFWGAKQSKNKFPSFLNTPINKMPSSPLFRKESITSKKLSKYGDADMDGSINFFDCNPRKVSEDGVVGDFLKKVFRSKKEKEFKEYSKDIRKLDPASRKQRYKMFQNQRTAQTKQAAINSAKRFSPGLAIERGIKGLTKGPTKNQFRARRRFGGRVISGVRLLTPAGTVPAPNRKTGTGKRGRPSGPSGRYFIPGVGAVGVYQYRAWLRQQKRVKRLEARSSPSSAVAAGSNTPAVQQLTSQQNTMQYEEEVPTQQYNQVEEMQMQQPMQQTQQPVYPTGSQGLVAQQQIQLQMQQRDNILLAPQFMKGELKNTGADLMSDKGRPNILQAPNAFLGQLRNMQARNPVELSQKPITNPTGEYYTDIDPISGQPILHKRPSERWMTGESL
ncbi:MAG: hypothetical protein ACHQ1D_00970 [Nitrososphaerales archaeon]